MKVSHWLCRGAKYDGFTDQPLLAHGITSVISSAGDLELHAICDRYEITCPYSAREHFPARGWEL